MTRTVWFRDILGLALTACLNAPIPERASFGVLRM